MARYEPKHREFLNPQMTGGEMLSLLYSYTKGVEYIPELYSEVTKGKYQYQVVRGVEIVSFAGGPRVALSIGIQGPFAMSMELGSNKFPRSPISAGTLRSATGAW